MRRHLFTLGLALLLLIIVPSFALAATVNIIEDAVNEPVDFTANPGALAQFINAFGTSKSGGGTTTFDSLTVTTTGTANIAKVEIRDSIGSVVLGSSTSSSGDDWTITPLNPKPGGNGGLYRVYVDVDGGATPSQTVTAYISAFVETSGAVAGTNTDTAGTTMTITSGGSCTPLAPTLALGSGVSIDASASTQYTITVTNNDTGAGCSDRSFDIVWQSDNMTPNDGSFTTPTTLSGTCNFTLAAEATNTACKLDVSSTAGAVDGTTLQTTVIDNTSSETGNVTTAISLGGVGCSMCHDYPPTDGARALATGNVVGSHTVHADQASWLVPTYIADCTVCHTDTTTGETDMAHRDHSIQMANPLLGGMYDKGADDIADTSWTQTKVPALGTCDSNSCHGPNNNPGPTWGGPAMTCSSCHNDGGGNEYPVKTTSEFRSAAAAGAHAAHMTGTAALMDGGVICIDCHNSYTNESDAGHFDTVAPADVPFPAAGDADLNSTGTSYAGGTCTVYCHVANLPGTTGATNNNTTPLWATDTSTGCDFCHGYPPNGTHSGSADCSSCHDHVEATNDNSFVGAANIAKHINGVVDSSGCTGCHGTDPKEYPPVSFWGADKNTADGVGAHVTHMENTASFLTKEDVNGDADDWCAECHTNSRGTGGHNDGYPAEVSFVDAVESSYNGTTPSFTPEGDTDPDNGVGGSCTVYCHGANMPNGDTGGSNRTPSWGDTITGCGACHAAPPANHGAVALNNCGDCHTTTMTTGLSTITNTANHINGTIEVDTSDCASCHNSGGFGAPLVGAATDHSTDRMDAVIGGAAWTCQDCHGGHGAGTIEIANATWPGNGADIFNYTSNGEGGIALGGARAPGGSEAEICWSCHFANGISEWGTNTNTNGGIYDYDFGAVSGQPNEGWVNSAGNTGATWTSANANFGYKTAPIQSTHGVVGGSQGLDSYANISCTHCHDVHNTGGGPSGKPFLRGNWVGSPYPEDGAPYWDAGNPYPGGGVGDTFDAVPRGSNFPDGLYNRDGGYWIDQNSGVDPDFNPISGFSAEQFGGLCEKCHGNNDGTFSSDEIDSLNVYGSGTTEWVSGYNGHENSVKGGSGIDGTDSGAEVTARNIFDVRGGTTSYGNNPFMHYAGMVDPGWQGTSNTWGFRGTNTKSGSTWGYNPTHATEQVRLYNVNNWGTDFDNVALSVDGALTNDRYHQFSCSKCHNPHASRLPALMITNCLDTKHNEWDNNLQLNASGGSNNDSRSISNWTSAQNCHRLGGVMTDGGDPAFDARSDAAGVGGGWNNVTPW